MAVKQAGASSSCHWASKHPCPLSRYVARWFAANTLSSVWCRGTHCWLAVATVNGCMGCIILLMLDWLSSHCSRLVLSFEFQVHCLVFVPAHYVGIHSSLVWTCSYYSIYQHHNVHHDRVMSEMWLKQCWWFYFMWHYISVLVDMIWWRFYQLE